MNKHMQNEYFNQINLSTLGKSKIKPGGSLVDTNIFEVINIIESQAAITSIMSRKGSPIQRLENYMGEKKTYQVTSFYVCC